VSHFYGVRFFLQTAFFCVNLSFEAEETTGSLFPRALAASHSIPREASTVRAKRCKSQLIAKQWIRASTKTFGTICNPHCPCIPSTISPRISITALIQPLVEATGKKRFLPVSSKCDWDFNRFWQQCFAEIRQLKNGVISHLVCASVRTNYMPRVFRPLPAAMRPLWPVGFPLVACDSPSLWPTHGE